MGDCVAGELYDLLEQRCPVELISVDRTCSYNELGERLERICEVNPYYVKMFLKKLVDEVKIVEEDDSFEWVYDMYVSLLSVGPPEGQTEDVIEYKFSDAVRVKIFEKPRLISCLSTTGFRTWEAAIYMCDYLVNSLEGLRLLSNADNFIELGAGTGLVSLCMGKILLQANNESKNKTSNTKKIYVTDGDSSLIEGQLMKNYAENRGKGEELYHFQRLIWNEDTVSIPKDINIVVGADITYDSNLFPALCPCIAQCLDQPQCDMAILSCTIRNEQTDREFWATCESHGLKVEMLVSSEDETQRGAVERIEQEIIFRKLIAPVRIYKITKR